MEETSQETTGQVKKPDQSTTGNPTAPTSVDGGAQGKEKNAPTVTYSSLEDFGQLTKHRLPWGVAGVLLWLLLFSVGVLIPAEPSRKNLGWTSESESQANTKNLEERINELEKKEKIPKLTDSDNKPPVVATGKPHKIWSFFVATFTFTPLNIGYLCILAAFIGGCSINKNEIHRIQQEIFDIEANPPVPPNPDIVRLKQRLDYLTEHPGYSTIRGLVVYLIIISGLFIIGAPLTGENGTQSVTLGQYMKLAGLFSFFGYLSGYDPTVFTSVVGLGSKHLSNVKTPS